MPAVSWSTRSFEILILFLIVVKEQAENQFFPWGLYFFFYYINRKVLNSRTHLAVWIKVMCRFEPLSSRMNRSSLWSSYNPKVLCWWSSKADFKVIKWECNHSCWDFSFVHKTTFTCFSVNLATFLRRSREWCCGARFVRWCSYIRTLD